ncbi:3D domain-containing protein [Patescibacteria group bacterium]|nr:3D domain-containing protein [Patescibacteria group bacterium]
MKKIKGKSRLKAYRTKKRIKKALFIGLIIDCLLWFSVFQSIKQLSKNNHQIITIQKTIIKEIEAKVKIGLITAYSCQGLETQAEILMNCPSLLNGKPTTANGTTPIANKTMACDTSNMGKSFEIGDLGVFTCTDTGGAIKGETRFDLYLENVEVARDFGKQHLIIEEVLDTIQK